MELSRSCKLWMGAAALLWPAVSRAQPRTKPPPPADAPPAAPEPLGDYADELSALSPQARALDAKSRARYSYCVRNTATYECVSYGADGNLRRRRRVATLHGTAFGYKQVDGQTLLLTNQHVAEWPAVTDAEHDIDDVPAGCKKVGDSLKIVDDDKDDYEADDIALTRVVSDTQLDVAILRARVPLEVLPWRIGHSAALRERDVVEVKGFPLGVFAATNGGKVVSAYDHDSFRDWDHDDFVIDALLSPGNSGSPVLAVSTKTGEFELVGIYHAAYIRGSALNVVVGIDQVRDLMTTLKRNPRPRTDEIGALDGAARAAFVERIRTADPQYFPFGQLVVRAEVDGGGSIAYVVYSKAFPVDARPLLAIEDAPATEGAGFGALGGVMFGGKLGLKRYERGDLDGDAQAQLVRIVEALRRNVVVELQYRDAVRDADASREASARASRLARTLARTLERQRELAQGATDLAERLSPRLGDKRSELAELRRRAPPAPAASPASAAPPPAVAPR